jgi:glycosyltransferase involved in cell wall biosynthesis
LKSRAIFYQLYLLYLLNLYICTIVVGYGMKKILIISYYFPPSGGSGVQRWLKFVKYLPEYGYDPIVLTVDPTVASYPQIDASLLHDIPACVRVERTTTREILSLYKRVSPTKEIPYGGFANENTNTFFSILSRFVRGNFFLPDPRRGWNKFAYKKACELIQQEQIDTVITTSPPHSTQLIGLKLKKRFPAIQWIADLRDPWRDIFYYKDTYPTPIADAINAYYERKVLLQADKLITVSNGCEKLFLQHAPVAHKFHVIPNGYDEDDYTHIAPIYTSDKVVVSYIGVLSSLYSIDGFLDAIASLSASHKERLLVRFVGKIAPEIKEKIRNKGIDLLSEYVDYVPHSEALAYMKSSNLLLLLLPHSTTNTGILTGKLFEYMASETPILLLASDTEEASQLLQSCQAGQAVHPLDSAAIQLALENAIDGKREKGTSKLYTHYSRRALTGILASIIS